MKVAFYTLGCKTNQFETQALEGLFQARGHEIVPFSAPADVYIVNTCTVTALSDKKSRNACRRARRLNPAGLLMVCGCYSQVSPEEARAACGADYVLGTEGKGRLVELAELAAQNSPAGRPDPLAALPRPLWGEGAGRPVFESLPAGGVHGRTRALLKVQDGCQSFCTYCLIPFARGPSRSIPLEEAVAEAGKLADLGFRELVVTGIEISAWGDDLPGQPRLETLLEAVCRAAPGLRVRLGSLEPRTVTEAFARSLAGLGNLCPHFHLSLQSGSDGVLSAMNRRYTAGRYLESCRMLRRHFPGCGLTADLIVGFPGESRADFDQSLALMDACGLSGAHIFPYSARRGTRAADLPGQLPRPEKEARAAEAAQAAARLERAYLAGLAGRTLSVLFERRENGLWVGYAGEYVPVAVAWAGDLRNRVLPVSIEGVAESGDRLVGRIAEG